MKALRLSNMGRTELLIKALSYLEDVTPQRFDCGQLCSGECCKETSRLRCALGEENTEMGMLLLPSEDTLLQDSDLTINERDGRRYAVCGGTCERARRPFACRIFPYYAKITQSGSRDIIKIKRDIRAVSFCPLLCARRKIRPSVYFLRNAKRAVRILLKDGEIREALLSESDAVFELENFYKAFFGGEK